MSCGLRSPELWIESALGYLPLEISSRDAKDVAG